MPSSSPPDYFRGEVVDGVNLAGLDRVIVCTSKDDMIYFRHYGVVFKKSGSKVRAAHSIAPALRCVLTDNDSRASLRTLHR